MRTMLLGLLFLVRHNDPVPPQDTWPQWRGPTGDSIAPAAVLPARWSKTENMVWKTPVPGWGNSTPAIWGDAIFVSTQDKDRLLLLRLDRQTGKIVWEREVGRGTPRRSGASGNGRYHDENNMASPSPVTDGQHVWVHFGTSDLACYDFAGNKVWAVNMIKLYGPYSIWWGHANSPVLYGDLLISACMQDPLGGNKKQDPMAFGKNYVVAMDKLTGKEKWFVKRETGATLEPGDAYTTPILYPHDGRVDLIVLGGQMLDAYDPATGKQLWKCSPFKNGNRVIPSPTVADGTIYAMQGMTGPLFAVRAGGAGDGDVTATNVRWKYATATPDAASPVVFNGLVFLATNKGIAVCLDAATGKELWKERLGDQFRATPLIAGGKVYFLSKEGKATVVEAARTFKRVWQTDFAEDIIPSPATAGGDLYIRTREHVYRIGVQKKEGAR